MVRRSKDWVFKLLGSWYWLEVGWPIKVKNVELGWKTKWGADPRFEWQPSFQIYFFKWQFVIWWNSPDGDNDQYYEQILWWLHYCKKNIKEAKKTWPWIDSDTKQSSWNDNYLI
jgi:hypothetical protein